ncbi:soluble catechol O-methyltransferase [Thamnocephalis sphaerospora]|uniref:catechol O-methyltransferase n=1 Tax=Thamnocephalis sphaerospora TaxID=78915 RepID=A0A4P9XWI3_9FUNG|nr:soluble catechol O-methyltransferase [Thamnocephalis sphaerospora]|eukprot:RKP10703.1 soluble catechol O-methyltransferase [Thamnocephalis sphaerospora]
MSTTMQNNNHSSSDTIEERVLRFVHEHARQGDPSSVIEAMDRFGKGVEWVMFVGDEKGNLVDEALRQAKPKVALELGAYCGYSAVRFGSLARQLTPGAKYYSFEPNELRHRVSSEVVRFAGLVDTVEIINGTFDGAIDDFLATHGEITRVDFVFIDHLKSRYVPDLRLLEDKRLLAKGSVVVGDNIIMPGAPEYWSYVSENERYNSRLIMSHVEYSKQEDAVAISICN